MTTVHPMDPQGHTVTLMEHNGCLYPPVTGLDAIIDSIPDLPTYDDDVMILGYPRSGTNWVWEVINMLVTGKAEHMNVPKIDYMLEYKPTDHINSLPRPRVLNTHLTFDKLPHGILQKKCKLVYVVRNPKDVAVSMCNFTTSDLSMEYAGDWEGFFELFLQGQVMYGKWTKCIADWYNVFHNHPEIPVLILPFEELKRDFSTNVRHLAKFLGVTYDDHFLEAVEEKCSFKNLKAKNDRCYDETEKSWWKDGKPVYLRKGDVGDWMNWFTIAQNERYDKVLTEELKDIDLKLVYRL